LATPGTPGAAGMSDARVVQEMAETEMAEGRRTSALFTLRQHETTAGTESWEAAVCQDQLAESLRALADSQQAQVRPSLAGKLRQLAQRVQKSRLKEDVRNEIMETIQELSGYLDRD